MNINIRSYQDQDFVDLRKLIMIVQDTEASTNPDRLSGEEMVDKYLEFLFKEHREKKGKIFIAEVDGKIAGMVAMRVELKDFELINKPIKGIFISDIAVYSEFRRIGVAKALLKKATDYAREKGLDSLRLSIVPKNLPALNLYKQLGFTEYELILVKEL